MGILLDRHVAVGNVCDIIMAFNKDACSVSLRCQGLPNNELLGSGARVSVGVREQRKIKRKFQFYPAVIVNMCPKPGCSHVQKQMGRGCFNRISCTS